jgi:2-polyprenyl-3-methyl-5-hydroxy-6-metoxy-1,4-benzoquinol methylase
MSPARIKESRPLNWSATSQDYLQHRPGYPSEFFILLQHLGVGLAGQEILDLGSGTGALAIPFAKQGAQVTAVDLSEGQIKAGQQAAQQLGASITFKVAPAETTGFPDHSFDVITASMCWLYFDIKRMEVEVPRLLRPNGLLLVSTLIWISDEDPLASQTDALLTRHVHQASEHVRGRDMEIVPAWSLNRFRLKTYHDFKVDLPFTKESWRGRLRASRYIGAALSPEKAAAFDRAHQELLDRIAPDHFNIRHRIRIQIFEPK